MIEEKFWSSLDLEKAAVRRRAEFYENYAVAADRFLEIDPDGYEGADGSPVGLTPFSDDPPDGGASGREPDGPEPVWAPREPWASQAERADALREAAIATLLLDSDRGRALLARSADIYTGSAPAYAMFLGAVARPQTLGVRSREAGQIVVEAFPGGDQAPALGTDGSSARLLHALLLVGATEETSRELPTVVERAAQSVAMQSGIPFGTAGSPLSDWWNLAIEICAPGERLDKGQIVTRFDKLARPHGEQLRVAQFDTYHWTRLYGRVDLVDLDLACAVALTNRRLAEEERSPITLKSFSGDLPRLAQVSLAVGIELGEPEVGPGSQTPPEAPEPGPEGTEPPRDPSPRRRTSATGTSQAATAS